MDVLVLTPTLLQKLVEGIAKLGTWFVSPLTTINGVDIIPLYAILPTSLLVILAICIVHFVTL